MIEASLTNKLPANKRKQLIKTLIIVIIAVFIALISAGGYYFWQYQSLKKQVKNSPLANQEEAKKLAAEVGRLVTVPTDEVPTIAAVTDITKLSDQPFFKDAKNGNKVLIYSNAKKAYLYDPTNHKVINIGPLNIGPQTGTATDTSTKPNIAIRNGTDIAGLAAKAESEIKSVYSAASVISKEQTNKKYDKTIIVVLNNDLKSVGDALARFYNAAIVDLPADEVKPQGADILVILGKDRSNQTQTPPPSPK